MVCVPESGGIIVQHSGGRLREGSQVAGSDRASHGMRKQILHRDLQIIFRAGAPVNRSCAETLPQTVQVADNNVCWAPPAQASAKVKPALRSS